MTITLLIRLSLKLQAPESLRTFPCRRPRGCFVRRVILASWQIEATRYRKLSSFFRRSKLDVAIREPLSSRGDSFFANIEHSSGLLWHRCFTERLSSVTDSVTDDRSPRRRKDLPPSCYRKSNGAELRVRLSTDFIRQNSPRLLYAIGP